MKTCLSVCIVLTAILLLAACGSQRLSDSEILATADAIRAKTPVPQSSKQVDEREFDDEYLDVLEEQYYSELQAAAENDLSRMDYELEWQATALAEYAEYADSSQPGQSQYSRLTGYQGC